MTGWHLFVKDRGEIGVSNFKLLRNLNGTSLGSQWRFEYVINLPFYTEFHGRRAEYEISQECRLVSSCGNSLTYYSGS